MKAVRLPSKRKPLRRRSQKSLGSLCTRTTEGAPMCSGTALEFDPSGCRCCATWRNRHRSVGFVLKHCIGCIEAWGPHDRSLYTIRAYTIGSDLLACCGAVLLIEIQPAAKYTQRTGKIVKFAQWRKVLTAYSFDVVVGIRLWSPESLLRNQA